MEQHPLEQISSRTLPPDRGRRSGPKPGRLAGFQSIGRLALRSSHPPGPFIFHGTRNNAAVYPLRPKIRLRFPTRIVTRSESSHSRIGMASFLVN